MPLAALLTPDESELAEHYPTRAEHLADGVVHSIGLTLATLGGASLVAGALPHSGSIGATAIGTYALSTTLMLTCSAAYNLTPPTRARRLLRRLDEAGIFVMIAGSFTPLLLKLAPAGGQAAALWSLAAAGSVAKTLLPCWSDRVWTAIYAAWAAFSLFIVAPSALGLPPTSRLLMAASCLAYGLGVRIFLDQALPYRRALWHALVVLGASFHCGALATVFLSPGA